MVDLITVDAIPETGNHWPGPPAMRQRVKSQLAKSGVSSAARSPQEIVKTVHAYGDTYDFPGKMDGLSKLIRVIFKQTKDFHIAVQQIAAHAIHITAIYTDTNQEDEGIWVEVEYEAVNRKIRTVFDRIERFQGVSSESPWLEVSKYTGLAERDVVALKNYLSALIKVSESSPGVRKGNGTSRVGWAPEFDGYSRPGYTRSGQRGLYSSATAVNPWTASGDLKTQRKVIIDLLRESPRALMVCGFAVAGVIMRPLGIMENYVLAMVGPDSSSLGKTSLALVIRSFFQKPSQLKLFDSTHKCLRASALYGNDSTVIIDEIGADSKSDEREREALVYGLAAGVARERLIRENGEYKPSEEVSASRYMAIISGEESLIDKTRARKGIKIRYTEIPVTTDCRLWSFRDSERMESSLATLQQNYGHIYPALIDALIDQPENLKDIKSYFQCDLVDIRKELENEKQSRKARIVALTRAGLLALAIVLDPNNEESEMWAAAVDASKELLDDYIDSETQSVITTAIASLPIALGQSLAVKVGQGAKMPPRGTMVGSMFPDEIRYRNKNFGTVESISSSPPGEEIKGTVITLDTSLAAPIVKEKLGVDLSTLIAEGIRHGLVKLNSHTGPQPYRHSVMTKFFLAENGAEMRKRGLEIIIPSNWEPEEAQMKPTTVNEKSPYDPEFDGDFDADGEGTVNDDYDNDKPPF